MPTNINDAADAARSIRNRIFPPSFFARNHRLMPRDYLRWRMAILQGFLSVNHAAARFVGSCCRQEVRAKFDIRTSPHAQRYVTNFVSRNFEASGPDRQTDENFMQKQKLVGFDVEGLCVHILQHPAEKGL
ncbi:MAG: hypothetical protein ABSG88_10465 [Bradyrhizobium sp.]